MRFGGGEGGFVCVSYLRKILNAFSILVGKINGQIS